MRGLHKCMGCGREYTSGEISTLRSCSNCKGNTFMFKAKEVRKVRKKALDSGGHGGDAEADIKVVDDGIFEVNVAAVALREPVIIEGDEGVFFIKFPKRKTANP